MQPVPSPFGLSPRGALGRRLRYRKFVNAELCALVFDSGYHLQVEVLHALRELGHRAIQLPISGPTGASTSGQAMAQLMRALVEHRPDFVVSVNHIGFDADGSIGQLCQDLQLPVALWYVDCPFFIHDGFHAAAPQVTFAMSWERAFVPHLRRLGVAHTGYLPLATCPARLQPAGGAPTAVPALAFVGSSQARHEARWRQLLDAHGQARAADLAARLAGEQALLPLMGEPQPAPDPRMVELALACLMASTARRTRALRATAPLPLHVFGDLAWQALLPGATWHPEQRYGAQLAAVYQRFAINLNVTSLQMPSAVNQRPFDVPAAGGFLLTDEQSDLQALFEPRALATYAGPEALAERAQFYLRHPSAREEVARRARRQVLAHHTYAHRMQTFVGCLRRAFASA